MTDVVVSVRVAPMDCWSCGAESNIVSSVLLVQADDMAECTLADFTAYPHLIDEIRVSLCGVTGVGELKLRFSRTLGTSYMSNGCAHCDALFGAHYEIHSRYDEQAMAELLRPAGSGWDEMLRERLG